MLHNIKSPVSSEELRRGFSLYLGHWKLPDMLLSQTNFRTALPASLLLPTIAQEGSSELGDEGKTERMGWGSKESGIDK